LFKTGWQVQQNTIQNVLKGTMKATEKTDYRLKYEQHFRNNFSFYDNDFRVQQIKNQSFIVPWQLAENDKRDVIVK
jgi:hypothetical protein